MLIAFFMVLYSNPYISNSPYYNQSHYDFGLVLAFSALIISIFYFLSDIEYYYFSSLDAVISLFLILYITPRFSTSYNYEATYFLFIVLLAYPIVRLGLTKTSIQHVLLKGVCCSAVLELLVSLIQGWNYSRSSDSNDLSLALKGTLDNSGLLSCYIVASSAIFLGYIRAKAGSSQKRLTTTGIFSIVVVLLIITKSRAALLAWLILGHVFFRGSISTFSPSEILKPVIIKFSLLFLGVASFVFLIYLKIDSLIGRLLIWKVTLSNVFEYLPFGIGYGNFAVEYNKWQAKYFSSSTYTLQEFLRADIIYTAFSEPLHIIVEGGILSFACALMIIYFFYKSKYESPQIETAIKASVSCILISSIFTYNLHSTPSLLLLIVLFAIASSISIKKIRFKPSYAFKKIMFGALIFLSGYFFLNLNVKRNALLKWKHAHELYKSSLILQQYREIYPEFMRNGPFLNDYAFVSSNFGRNSLSIYLYSQGQHYFPDLEANLRSCELLIKENKLNEAEEKLLALSQALPNRFYPKYLLANLYILKNDTPRAKYIAKRILEMPVKVKSPSVESIRGEMILFLKSN